MYALLFVVLFTGNGRSTDGVYLDEMVAVGYKGEF